MIIRPEPVSLVTPCPGNHHFPPGNTLPYDDGEPLESDWHVIVMNLLIGILRYYWWDRPDIYVAGNMFVYFDPDQVKTHNFRGPAVFVVKQARRAEAEARRAEEANRRAGEEAAVRRSAEEEIARLKALLRQQ